MHTPLYIKVSGYGIYGAGMCRSKGIHSSFGEAGIRIIASDGNADAAAKTERRHGLVAMSREEARERWNRAL